MKHTGSQILTTARLVLRPWRKDDAHDMYENWAHDSDVTKYMTWLPHESEAETRALLTVWEEESKLPTTYHWAITYREGGKLIGDICAVDVNETNERCTIGYCLMKAEWGKGVMTEALQEMLRYLFEEVGFHRVIGQHVAENIGSSRVMEKCGLRYEGLLRRQMRLPSSGEWADIVTRGILREDFLKRS